LSAVPAVIAAATTAVVAYRLTKFLSWKFNHMGITGVDVHKPGRPLRAEMGGLAVLVGYVLGSAILVPGVGVGSVFFVASSSIVVVGLIGIIDDLFGIRQRYKPLLVAAASSPVAYFLINRTDISFPFVGPISFGLMLPLFIVPLAVATSANFTNMLAGFNGLEAGVASINIGTLAFLCFLIGKSELALAGVLLALGYFGFLLLNWYPAKIFPGDTGTLMSGAAIATIGLIAGLEFQAIVLSMPAALDFALKMLSKRPFSQRSAYGDSTPRRDGTLEPAGYPALAHAFLKISQLSERELVSVILLMQFCYAVLAVVLTLTVA